MPTTAEFLNEQLARHGVGHLFHVPGSYTVDYLAEVGKTKIKPVGTTCEANAGFAADAYARVRGLGAVCATYCVGGFNLVNSTAAACAEKSPVLVIGGAPGVKEREGKFLLHHTVRTYNCQHDVFKEVCCATALLDDPNRAGYEIERVLTAIRTHKRPGYIELPRDMVTRAIRYDPYTVGTPKDAVSDPTNLAEVIGEVSEWLGRAERPVILADVEVARWGLGAKITKWAEQNNIPFATTILGKSVFNERHPLSLGVYMGSASRPEVRDAVENSDCLLMLGVMQTELSLGFLPVKNQRRSAVLATSETTQVCNHSYEDVRFVDFVEELVKVEAGWAGFAPAAKPAPEPFAPQKNARVTTVRVFEKIQSVLKETDAVITDVGDSLFGALDLTVHHSNQFLCDAFYLSMGFAVPAALGVQLADPALRSVVVVGDGAAQMTGAEFSTLVRNKLNPIVVVLNNQGYTTERFIKEGAFNDIQPWNFENLPALVGGGVGHRVETEEELDQAFNAALRETAQPTIIHVVLSKNDHTPTLSRIFQSFKGK